jgi:tRNA(Ile)-lysidine synthase
MWQLGEKVGVAVSGGADSVYLLHFLHSQIRDLTVLHANHRLRGTESDADEAFVRVLAESLRLRFISRCTPVPAGNREEAAREARYSWFRMLIKEGCVDRVALGHSQSDQAETVLFRFLRGSGTAGLAAIRPETSDGFVRPLLHLTRAEIRESLRARGIAWREDASNDSQDFARNRIRHSLLPQLSAEWNPSLSKALAQTAEWALAEEAYWADELKRLAAGHFETVPSGLIVHPLEYLPVAVQRRLLRHAIETARGNLRQIDFSHVEAVRSLRGGQLDLPGLKIEKSFGILRLGPPVSPRVSFRSQVEPPATVPLAQSDLELTFKLASADCVYNENEHQIDWGLISGSLELQYWQPGDRYRRVGRSNEEKLKVLFQKARVPVWERQSWPILRCGNQIAWARKFGAAAQFARTPLTQVVLLICENSNRNRQ